MIKMAGVTEVDLGRHHLQRHLPYVPPSSLHFQIGIWSPKQHRFDREFWVGLCHTLCKQWAKGFCKISNFWPLHSVWQNVAGFRRGLFTCFLGHTPLLQYYLLFGPHHLLLLWRTMLAQLAAIWMSSENSGVQQQGVADIDLTFKLQPVVQALVLHNCNKGCGPKSR